MKEHLSPNAVLVKRNNFYFFDKGVQMKSKGKANLVEDYFFRSFSNQDKKPRTPSSTARENKPPTENIDTQHISQMDSIFMNSFTLKPNNQPAKPFQLKNLKFKKNHQDLNKIFEEQRRNSSSPKLETAKKLSSAHENNPLVREKPRLIYLLF